MTVELVQARWVVTGVSDGRTADVLADAAVAHEQGAILAVDSAPVLRARYPDAVVADYPHHVLLPGFVNAHHHVGLTPLQLGSPDLPLELWFASRLGARDVDPTLDTLYSAFEMIASGVTCVQHLQPRFAGPPEAVVAGCSQVLAAYRRIGLRVSFSYAMREQNRLVYKDDAAFCARLPTALGTALATQLARHALTLGEQLEVYRALRDACAGEARVRIQLAPANLHWMTDDGLQRLFAQARADAVPLHLHLLETPYQREYARRRTGTTAVRHLHRLGGLGPDLTLGHAVWVDQGDIELLAATGTCVCHNCSSNLRLGSGVAPVNGFARHGIPTALGIDEAGLNDDRDMLQEMRLALRLHRHPGLDAADVPSCGQVLRMATEHGAATTPWRGAIGRLAPGLRFDAVAIDYAAAVWPYQDTRVPPIDALLLRARPAHVDTVWVDGDAIYAKGRFKYVDREAVLAEIAARMAAPESQDERMRRRLAVDVMPHVRAFYRGYL